MLHQSGSDTPPTDAATHGLKAEFRRWLVDQAPATELEGLSPEDLDRLTDTAWACFQQRRTGQHIIHVGAGEGEAARRHMPVVLITDDMPFLVDSATLTIAAEGLEIQRLFHPIIPVKRDAQGAVVALGDTSFPLESAILMEVDRAPARTRQDLQQNLEQAYTGVRRAVADWQPMLNELRNQAHALNDNPPKIDRAELAENIAFLEWLAADNFTLLGYQDGNKRLGLLVNPDLPLEVEESTLPVGIHKSNIRSSVHRRVPMDLISVRRFDDKGQVKGTAFFLGLFTSAALREAPSRVPLIRRKVQEVARRLNLEERSHGGRALAHVLESFPREELFQIDTETLTDVANGLLSLQTRPRPHLFARRDAALKKASILAYIPRDLYSADLRRRIGEMLVDETGGSLTKFDAELRGEGMGRVHYQLDAVPADIDSQHLNNSLAQLTRGWESGLEAVLAEQFGATRAARLLISHGRAFPVSYRDEFTPEEAAVDVTSLTKLSTPADRYVTLYRRGGDPETIVRLKVFRLGEIIPLSDSVPMLENFGFRVIEEDPYDLNDGHLGWIHDFRLETTTPVTDLAAYSHLVAPALKAVLQGDQENDLFNALIPSCGFTAEEANWIRAWFRYLRQTGANYSIQTLVDTLKRNVEAGSTLLALFRGRLAPEQPATAAHDAQTRFQELLNQVQSIDEDRVLSLLHGLILSMLRTNAFVPDGPEALAFKMDSTKVPGLPKPLPWREIWVYSPRVEGIHLRGGPIARGGLRWSDRRDDFRTEVLGLVKAQVVKNTVIVPTGAKGGFFAKQLPDPAVDRDGWAAEGRASYEVFIRALLTVTDNLDAEGHVLPPPFVTRLDGDDPYLVVAADKGTATFSDTANAIAQKAGFWLGDAFASGGSAGYDHKEMGITARGAWVSVTRHFAEIGVDVQTDAITVAGVGDMSGDVFGNGMLRSKSLKLVAAFDHRHIFLDPAPDAARSWEERQRLFDLPRSSWADYTATLISEGGGVYPRTQKSIPLTPQVKALLKVEEDALAPADLISAILKAETDLLWFGGIGTYIKSADETHADVGDRANDAVRVNGADLRAKVVGEGANLGVTQAGRIEYAARGGRINTDFIDNSAGVDTSDHEVNIKIALGTAVRSGKLTLEARNSLLEDMTDEVATSVLSDNSAQTLVLSVAQARAAADLAGHVRLMEMLESSGRLDRQVEGLPGPREIEERQRVGAGLTRPELAILMAYTKMELKDQLAVASVVQDPLLEPDLFRAFPPMMRETYADEINGHQLRREIIATKLANLMVNRGGLTMAHDLAAELGLPLSTIAAAFVAARRLFDLEGLWQAIDTADIPAANALGLHAEAAAITRVLVSDLAVRHGVENPQALALRLAPGLSRILPKLESLLRREPKMQVDAVRQRLAITGAPAPVIDWIATLHALTGAAGVVALAEHKKLEEAQTAQAYTRLGEALGLDWALGAARALTPADSWERLLAATIARDLEAMRLQLILDITPEGGEPLAATEAWLSTHQAKVESLVRTFQAARQSGTATLPMLAQLNTIARSTLSA